METKERQRLYLTPQAIYKYLGGMDDRIDTLIMCNTEDKELITTDQSLYEAMGSFDDKSKINLNKLVKLLETVSIRPYEETLKKKREILTHDRAEEIRKLASDEKDDEKGVQ